MASSSKDNNAIQLPSWIPNFALSFGGPAKRAWEIYKNKDAIVLTGQDRCNPCKAAGEPRCAWHPDPDDGTLPPNANERFCCAKCIASKRRERCLELYPSTSSISGSSNAAPAPSGGIDQPESIRTLRQEIAEVQAHIESDPTQWKILLPTIDKILAQLSKEKYFAADLKRAYDQLRQQKGLYEADEASASNQSTSQASSAGTAGAKRGSKQDRYTDGGEYIEDDEEEDDDDEYEDHGDVSAEVDDLVRLRKAPAAGTSRTANRNVQIAARTRPEDNRAAADDADDQSDATSDSEDSEDEEDEEDEDEDEDEEEE